MERAIFASVVANFNPTQFRGPIPKGKKAAMLLLVALAIPSENLSGLKRCTSSPHILGSWWGARVGMYNNKLAGRVSFPSLTSLSTFLVIAIIGGYNLRDSLMIIPICMGNNVWKIKNLRIAIELNGLSFTLVIDLSLRHSYSLEFCDSIRVWILLAK